MLPLLLLLLFTLQSKAVISELVLESGYSVSTVIDFNKQQQQLTSVQPFSLLPRALSRDLILLDSTNSAFYSLPVPFSHESGVRLFSGAGIGGFSDGDITAAKFDKPRSFAIDSRDNVYVADRKNHAIRKISSHGHTTTIAGGYSEITGHTDGPAQNASFSPDFELVYVPRICALLISDRGNRLIRQINLKPEDCVQKTKSGLGALPVSMIAILCALVGSVLGFVARPLFAPREVSCNHFVNKTRKHYQANLRSVILTTFSAVRSAVANSAVFILMLRLFDLSISYLSVVLRNVRLEKQFQHGRKIPFKVEQCKAPYSLLESDVATEHSVQKLHTFADQLEDLISFDEGIDVLEVNKSFSSEKKDGNIDDSNCSFGKIDGMIKANLSDFGGNQSSKVCSSSLIQRRSKTVNGQ